MPAGRSGRKFACTLHTGLYENPLVAQFLSQIAKGHKVT